MFLCSIDNMTNPLNLTYDIVNLKHDLLILISEKSFLQKQL